MSLQCDGLALQLLFVINDIKCINFAGDKNDDLQIPLLIDSRRILPAGCRGDQRGAARAAALLALSADLTTDNHPGQRRRSLVFGPERGSNCQL